MTYRGHTDAEDSTRVDSSKFPTADLRVDENTYLANPQENNHGMHARRLREHRLHHCSKLYGRYAVITFQP